MAPKPAPVSPPRAHAPGRTSGGKTIMLNGLGSGGNGGEVAPVLATVVVLAPVLATVVVLLMPASLRADSLGLTPQVGLPKETGN